MPKPAHYTAATAARADQLNRLTTLLGKHPAENQSGLLEELYQESNRRPSPPNPGAGSRDPSRAGRTRRKTDGFSFFILISGGFTSFGLVHQAQKEPAMKPLSTYRHPVALWPQARSAVTQEVQPELADQDQAELSGGFWERAERAGLMVSFGALPEPGLTAALAQASLNEGLVQELEALEELGAEFTTYKRTLLGSRETAITASEAATRLEKDADLFLQRPGGEGLGNIKSLAEVRHFQNLLKGQPDQELLQAVEAIPSPHRDNRSVTKAYCRAASGQGIRLWLPWREPEPDEYLTHFSVPEIFTNRDHILAFSHFVFDGPKTGLASEPAERLGQLVEEGLMCGFEAFHAYTGLKPEVELSRAGGLLLPPEAFDDLEAVTELARRYRRVMARYPTLELPKKLRREPSPFSIESRAEAFDTLLEAAQRRNLETGSADAARVFDSLLTSSRNEIDFLARLDSVAQTLAYEGPEDAAAQASQSRTYIQDSEQALFEHLSASMGAGRDARQAVNLVRIPIAQESQQERLAIVEQLASRLPEERKHLTDDLYQALLIHRLPDQPLTEAAEDFVEVLEACLSLEKPNLTVPVFAATQKAPAAQRSQLIRSFAHAAIISDSVEEAFRSLASQQDGLSASLQVGEDEIIINGVSIFLD